MSSRGMSSPPVVAVQPPLLDQVAQAARQRWGVATDSVRRREGVGTPGHAWFCHVPQTHREQSAPGTVPAIRPVHVPHVVLFLSLTIYTTSPSGQPDRRLPRG